MDKKEYAKQRLKERTASKRFKLPEGITIFRVLPNKRGNEYNDFFEYGMHSQVGPQNRYIRCGKKDNGDGECWLCEKIAALEASSKSSHRAAAQKMVRVGKFAVQIATISDEGKWFGPTLWEMPQGLANGLLGVFHRKNVVDLQKGYNLNVERTGTSFKGTSYGSILLEDDPSKVPSGIVAKMKTFGELVPKYNAEEQKAAYYGHEQDEEPEPQSRTRARDEEEPTEGEEVEERTVSKKAGKPKVKPRQQEEEGEPADVEDSELQSLEEEAEVGAEEGEPFDVEEEVVHSRKPTGKKGRTQHEEEVADEEPIGEEDQPADEEEPSTEEEEERTSRPAARTGKRPVGKPPAKHPVRRHER